MQEIRNDQEQSNLKHREQDRDKRGLGRQQLGQANAHQALSRDADSQGELADEISIWPAAKHDRGGSTQQRTDQQARCGRLHHDAESSADKSQ